MIVKIKAEDAQMGMKVYPRMGKAEYVDNPGIIQSVSTGVRGNRRLLTTAVPVEDKVILIFYTNKGWAVYFEQEPLYVEVDFVDHSKRESSVEN